jgi:hypothetical protein
MDLAGPFLVAGRAVPTGLTMRAGDRLAVLASGLLGTKVPGNPVVSFVDADGLAGVAPAGWPAPGLRQLSLVALAGGQAFPLGKGFTRVIGAPAGAAISLDANAPPLTEFTPDTGWSVYVVRAAAGETLPAFPDWSMFEDLTSTDTRIDGGIAAALLDDVIHVLWVEATGGGDDALRHLTIAQDGSVAGPTTLATAVAEISQVSAVVHRGALSVFFCQGRRPGLFQGGVLGVLLRGSLNAAGTLDLNDVDGSGGNGIRGVVGINNTALVTGGELHVLYQAFRDRNVQGDPGDGLGAPIDDLRWASTTLGPEVPGAPVVWTPRTIDGAGGAPGQVSGFVGSSIAALADAASQPHVFYALMSLDGRGQVFDLRHAELDWTGADTRRWRWETIDGAGRTLPDATGQIRGRVGPGAGCAFHDGAMHVFYNEITNANLRWGTKAQGQPWRFATIDGMSTGAAGGALRYGPSPNRMRNSPKAVLRFGDQLDVFYDDQGGARVRHAWLRPGLPWMFEVVDGDLAYDGRVRSMQRRPAAVVRGNELHLFYADEVRQRLRHAVLSR